MKKLISIVIPMHNESKNISKTYFDLIENIRNMSSYRFEILLVDDGSEDDTLIVSKQLKNKVVSKKIIEFSRNFGKEAATSAGIKYSSGDAVIIMDADGQHPSGLIPNLVESWANGNEVVIGVRTTNSGEGLIKKYGSKIYYKLLNILTDGNTVPGSTDFRLLDKKVVTEFNKLTERGRITRGLIDWLGYKRSYIEFAANERSDGKASYTLPKLIKLALNAFVSQSTKPLKAVGLLGLIVTIISTILGFSLFIEQYILGDPLKLSISGTAFLAVFLSFLVGIVLVCQGLLALYIESIHTESQNRPLYIVARFIER
jgi:dolichol-phosphate mannosyltransferase